LISTIKRHDYKTTSWHACRKSQNTDKQIFFSTPLADLVAFGSSWDYPDNCHTAFYQ